MLVKARRNVRDASGWHTPGSVFQTDADLGDAVEVLIPDAPKKAPDAQGKAPEAEKSSEAGKTPEMPADSGKEEAEKPRGQTRRKNRK